MPRRSLCGRDASFDSMGDDAPPLRNGRNGRQSGTAHCEAHPAAGTRLTAHAMAERKRDSYSSATGRAGKAGKSGRAADGETAAAMASRLEKMLTARKIVLCNKTDCSLAHCRGPPPSTQAPSFWRARHCEAPT